MNSKDINKVMLGNVEIKRIMSGGGVIWERPYKWRKYNIKVVSENEITTASSGNGIEYGDVDAISNSQPESYHLYNLHDQVRNIIVGNGMYAFSNYEHMVRNMQEWVQDWVNELESGYILNLWISNDGDTYVSQASLDNKEYKNKHGQRFTLRYEISKRPYSYSLSISTIYRITEITKRTKGKFIEEIKSTKKDEYPINGVKGNYWYEFIE